IPIIRITAKYRDSSRGLPACWVVRALLTHEHGLGLALEVEVLRAADVDRDAPDRATGEAPWLVARVVGGDSRAAVPTDAQPLSSDHELAGLGLDVPLADLGVPMPQREHSDGHARRIFSALVEGGGQEELLAGRQVFGADDVLFGHADEVVDVVQPAVLDVKRVAAERGAVREQDAFGACRGEVDECPDRVGAVADVDGLRLGDLGGIGEVDVPVAWW